MVLTNNEKGLLIYLQKNAKAYASTPTQEFNYLWQGAGLTKIDAQIALDKLVKKKMMTVTPSNKKTAEQRELFGNIYRLTPKGSLYKFSSRWSILTSIGITITTIASVIAATFTILQYVR